MQNKLTTLSNPRINDSQYCRDANIQIEQNSVKTVPIRVTFPSPEHTAL